MNNKLTKQAVGFVQISNDFLNDTNISLKAKGLFSYMYSKPNNWNFTLKGMGSQLKESHNAITTAIKELKAFGYVDYKKNKDGSGEYLLYSQQLVEENKPINPKPQNKVMGTVSKKEVSKRTVIKKERESNKENTTLSFSEKLLKEMKSKYPLKDIPFVYKKFQDYYCESSHTGKYLETKFTEWCEREHSPKEFEGETTTTRPKIDVTSEVLKYIEDYSLDQKIEYTGQNADRCEFVIKAIGNSNLRRMDVYTAKIEIKRVQTDFNNEQIQTDYIKQPSNGYEPSEEYIDPEGLKKFFRDTLKDMKSGKSAQY